MRKLSEVLENEPETLQLVRTLCKLFNAQSVKLVDNDDHMYYNHNKEAKPWPTE
jgi:hypothetical protein